MGTCENCRSPMYRGQPLRFGLGCVAQLSPLNALRLQALKVHDDEKGLLFAAPTSTCLRHPTRPPRRSSAGDLAELVGGGRGLWLSCPPAQQLCLVNPYLSRCLQEKQGISLQAIRSFKLELVTHSKYICTE